MISIERINKHSFMYQQLSNIHFTYMNEDNVKDICSIRVMCKLIKDFSLDKIEFFNLFYKNSRSSNIESKKYNFLFKYKIKNHKIITYRGKDIDRIEAVEDTQFEINKDIYAS